MKTAVAEEERRQKERKKGNVDSVAHIQIHIKVIEV